MWLLMSIAAGRSYFIHAIYMQSKDIHRTYFHETAGL